MENSILNNWAIDPAYLILGLGVLTLILLVVTIICMIRIKKLYRKYDIFMRGKDAENLEDIIFAMIDDLKTLKSEERANKEILRTLSKKCQRFLSEIWYGKIQCVQRHGRKFKFCLCNAGQQQYGICTELGTQSGRLLFIY